jgi:hypothetical protein
MGLSALVIAELLNHPRDVYFGIVPLRDAPGYGLMVTRGPGHNYKPLFDWANVDTEKSKADVVQFVRNLFKGIMDEVKKTDSFVHALVAGEAEVLNRACLDKILVLLAEHGNVDTHVLWPVGTPLPISLPDPIPVNVKISDSTVAALLKNPRDLRVEITHVAQEGGYVLRVDRGPQGGGKPLFATSQALDTKETAVAVALGALMGLFNESNEPGTMVRGQTADADELLCGYCIEALCKELLMHGVVRTNELWPPGTSLPG